jgi:hypothetical protein
LNDRDRGDEFLSVAQGGDPQAEGNAGCLFLFVLIIVSCVVWGLASLGRDETLHDLFGILADGLDIFRPTQFGFWLLVAGLGSWPLARWISNRPVRVNPLFGVHIEAEDPNRILRWQLASAPSRSPFITLSLQKSA